MKNLFFTLALFVLGHFVSAQGYNVAVTIDMASYTGPSFTSVMMNGGFNSWGDALSLTTDEDSLVWTTTATMNGGINDYRFEVGGGEVGWNAEWEGKTSTGDCFINLHDSSQSNMRWITVAKDSVLPTFCWEKCTSCSVEEPTSAEVTVTIDMTSYTGPSFTSVMMNGGFNGWGDAISLTTDDDSLVWATTFSMNIGINDYRFEVGGGEVGWNAEWEGKTSTGDCFINLYDSSQTNMRWITVTKDSVLSTVCWESCSTCGTTLLSKNNQNNIDIFLNNSNELIITGLDKTEEPLTLRIIDLNGSQIRIFKNIQPNSNKVSLNGIMNGIYIINIYNRSIVVNKKIIKQ